MLSLYMTILFAGFLSGMCMETCPEAEDIQPCKCREWFDVLEVECSHDSLDTLQQALRSFVGKNSVRLRLEGFSVDIPSDFFAGIGIERLKFYSCHIDSLANDDQPMLSGLEDHLKEFGIYDSFAFPAKLGVGHLKKLNDLTVDRSSIGEVGDVWFGSGPSSLNILQITGNNVTTVGSEAFSRLTNLQLLQLEDNRFGPIERSMLPSTADKLEVLFLDNNGLTDLPVDIFSRMPSLVTVFLNSNEITTLDERTWSPVWEQLKSISLRDNKIVCDDRLNWIIKSGKWPLLVKGKCSAPKELEGVNLVEFFKNRKH